MNSLKIVLVFAFFVVAVIAVEEKRKELDAIKDVKSNALSTEIKKEDLKTEKKKADLKEEIEKKKEDLKKRLEIPVKEKEEEDNDVSINFESLFLCFKVIIISTIG